MTDTDNIANDFDIFDWIESGTVARRTVEIYNDPGVAAEYEGLERELEAAERDAQAERTVGESDVVTDLLERMESLWRRWQASKAVWTVQALPQERVREIFDEVALPEAPVEPAKDAPKGEQTKYKKALEKHLHKVQEVVDERNFRLIAAAVVSVETSRGSASSVPVEAVRRLHDRTHGPDQVTRLVKAVEDATTGEVVIPAPKSRRPQRGSRD